MLNLLGINVNQWVIYIICIVLGAAIIFGGYFWWKHDVTSVAQLQFDNAQLKQSLADKQKFIDQMNAINAAQSKSVTDLTTFNAALANNLKDLGTYLGSPTATKDDRTSSPVLKNTLTRLKAIK